MDEDWRNAFGILMCMEICNGTGAGICDGVPLTCSSVFCFQSQCYKEIVVYLWFGMFT